MAKKDKQIQCLKRLIKFTSCYGTILDLLLQEKVITQADMHRGDKDEAFHLYSLIEEGRKSDKLQLVSYEWRVLPAEYITLTLLTKMVKKEFTYEEP